MSNRCDELTVGQRCIHEVFESQASANPNRTALTFEDQQLTYGELNARANRLAARLQKLGVGPETLVGLCVERSVEMVVGILGILKAGGAYVPVDPSCPADRLSFILHDAAAPILLTQKKLGSKLASLQPDQDGKDIRVIYLDSGWSTIQQESSDNLKTAVTEQNAAYVIYTSGSTGKPKGVTVTHKNVTRLFSATDHWFHFGADDVWTLFHSYAFDFSVWEIWGALLYGGRLVVVPYLTSRSPAAFYELLAAEKVTVLNQTPSAFRQLIWAEATTTQKRSLSLRYVIFGGEALELQSLKTWFELHGDKQPQLVNMYGITETTVHVTYRPITAADLQSGAGSVIGVPIPDLQLHVLTEDLKPAAVCEPGEIFVGGLGVARGYLNRPELTAQRFIKDPFSSDPNAVLYRSGDLARRLSNGDLEYLGRIDHQVKIRGFRIELGEIESALNQHAAVRESIVIAQDHGDGSKRLVSYVVPKNEAPSITELREYLGKAMPDYMIPAVFIFMESLPLTTNGKVDRAALPSPDRVRPTIGNEFVAARTPVEQSLASIWSEVLDVANVGVRDNFFELGGDSISSIAVLSKAQKRGMNFSLQQLFQNPTVEGLARSIETSTEKAVTKRTEPFSLISEADKAKLPADVEDAYPMIQLQTGMFYYNEVNPLSAVYHDVFSFKINSVFDREKLEKAVNQLVQRHTVLRTSFHIGGYSEPMQLVHRSVKVPFTVEDVRHLSAAEQEKRTIDWIEVEKRNPFDRTVAPLIRFHTQVQSDNAFQFIVSFHHVYLDGWSLAALMTEIFQDYAALRQGSGEEIAAPQITYREFVALEKEAVAGDVCRNFWTNKLAGAQVQNLPRWPKHLCEGGHEQKRGPEINIKPEVFEGLKRICQKAGVPLKTVLLAAHQRVMALLYGQTDVVSGLVCNGRPEEIDGEKLIGLFLNTLPIRTRLEGGTWIDLVKQTFAEEQQIIPHRRFPLAEIHKINGGQPVFEAAFDFVHFHVYKNLQAYGDMGFMEGHYFEANNLTTLTTFMLDITSTNLQMHMDYDPTAITREQVCQISYHYINALEAMAAAPESSYNAVSLLSRDEEEQLFRKWNATEEPLTDACVHQLFEGQAVKTPDAIAINYEGQKVTYRELNARADEVAARLQEAGIRPDALVGVFVERSPEMVAALLGVLKAGGAYVPLDPAYPQERLAQMIEDAEMPVILTQKKLVTRLPQSAATAICLEDVGFAEQQCKRVASGVKCNNLAYVIYTSGSTGKPKGVQIEHRSVVNLLVSIARKIRFSPEDHLLAVTTMSFDIAGLEIFMPLISGAQLTIVPRDKAADGNRLAEIIDNAGATCMQATPATWRLLIEAGWKGRKNFKVLCGGEALSRKLADELNTRADEVWNVYGPTETTIWSTAWKVQPNSPILVGEPLANTQLYILDTNGQPVPTGVVGELHIGGDGLARGYLKRRELTAEKFIEVGVGGSLPKRVYKTGDLARFLPDGNVECLGRVDHQVKIRGYRIELGDIEAALRQNTAAVKEALVMAREDVPGDKRLVAYIVPANGTVATSELRDYLKTKLPEFMVPSAYVSLPQFPLTPSGKIDRKALPSPTNDRAVSSRQFVEPSTPFEIAVADIWSEVFHLEKVSADDNFYDLGGHSLLAIQIVVRIREKLGVDLPMSALFEQPTVSGLAEATLQALVQNVGGVEAVLSNFSETQDAEEHGALVAAK